MLLRVLSWPLFSVYFIHYAEDYRLLLITYMIHILMVLKSILAPGPLLCFWPLNLNVHWSALIACLTDTANSPQRCPPTRHLLQLLTATMTTPSRPKPETWASSLTSVLKFHQRPNLLTAFQMPFWICWLVSFPFYNLWFTIHCPNYITISYLFPWSRLVTSKWLPPPYSHSNLLKSDNVLPLFKNLSRLSIWLLGMTFCSYKARLIWPLLQLLLLPFLLVHSSAIIWASFTTRNPGGLTM